MVARDSLVLAAILLAVVIVLPLVPSEDPSADSMFHVTFYDSDGSILSEGDWTYRSVPYCVYDPVAPDGTRFVGWCTSASSDVAEPIVPVEHDTIYYPVFMATDSVYGVTFDPSNDTDVPRTLYGERGSVLTIPTLQVLGFDVKYDRGPFILDVWSSPTDEYAVGQGLELTGDLYLTASWIRSVAVTPEFDEDLPSEVSMDRFSDDGLHVSCTETDGDGITFEWFLRDSSGDTSIGTGPTMSLPDTIVSFPGIYTVFVRATNIDHTAVTETASADSTVCSVTVRGQYVLSVLGTGLTSIHAAGESVTVPEPHREGHSLVGISRSDGIPMSDGNTFVMPGYDLILIPEWEAYVCTVRFFSGEEVIDSDDLAHGTLIQLPVAPVREGSVLKGWSIEGVIHQPGTNVLVRDDMDVHAVWAPLQPECTVDGEAYVGETLVLGAEGVLYWYDSDGTRYLPGETVTVTDGQAFISVPL